MDLQDLSICVTAPFFAPEPTADLVVFSNEQPFVPFEEAEGYFRRCKQYAAEHGMWLATGLVAIADQLCMFLFDRAGKLKGAQRALYLHKSLRTRFRRCGELTTFDTEFGQLCLCVDVDVYYPEVARAARLQGCDVMICSQFIAPGDYAPTRITFGAWDVAQSDQMLVVCTTNHDSAICAPAPLTEHGTGYVVRPNAQRPLCGSFPLEALARMPGRLTAESYNRTLYQNYFADLQR